MKIVDLAAQEQCIRSYAQTVALRLKSLSSPQRVSRSTVENAIRNIESISNAYDLKKFL